MNRLLFLSILFLYSCSINEAEERKTVMIGQSNSGTLTDTCIDFNSVNNKIRDGLISKQEALHKLQNLLPQIKCYFYQHHGQDCAKSKWVFPVEGYNSRTIGGQNGSGYIASGYDYFDGDKHGGHPAHDIFIIDKNQDCLDDITKKHVNVLSMTTGIVIATNNSWDSTSKLRGGKYIWIYDPYSNSLFYYAHNSTILVKPCDIVKPGDIIAIIGRTGLNAYKRRSPTHLHFMQLKLDSNYYPRPVDCYKELKTVRTVQ